MRWLRCIARLQVTAHPRQVKKRYGNGPPKKHAHREGCFRGRVPKSRRPALSLASVRPSPLPDGANRVTGTAPAANTDDARRLHRLDIAGRMKMLREAFERHAHPDNSKADREDWRDHLSRLAQQAAPHRSRLLKVGVGALLVLAVGWLPVRTLLQTTSTEAVINARLITLRAPIEGEIGAGLGATAVGTQLEPGAGADEDRQPARRARTPRRPAPPHQPARKRAAQA